jgi:hypothetical protein
MEQHGEHSRLVGLDGNNQPEWQSAHKWQLYPQGSASPRNKSVPIYFVWSYGPDLLDIEFAFTEHFGSARKFSVEFSKCP